MSKAELAEWHATAFKQFFETPREKGVAYITCPDHARPTDAKDQEDWVICVANSAGGFIVRKGVVDRLQNIQILCKVLSVLGPVLALILGTVVGYKFASLAAGVMAGIVAGVLLLFVLPKWMIDRWGPKFDQYDWYYFPLPLCKAIEESEKNIPRRQMFFSVGGTVLGFVAGHMANEIAGKIAETAADHSIELFVDEVSDAYARGYVERAADILARANGRAAT